VNSELDGDVKTGTISLASNLRLEVSSYIHFTGFALQELLLSGRAKTKIYFKSQPKTGYSSLFSVKIFQEPSEIRQSCKMS
jgi:hypothetical protein